MLFQFSGFCFLFLTLILFHIIPARFRKWTLLAASVIFIRWQGKASGLFVISLITAIAWIMGMITDRLSADKKEKEASFFSALTIILFVIILFGWKYLFWAAGLLGFSVPDRVRGIGIPVGLSFFTFQAISYMADIRLGKINSEKNPFRLSMYMMWFPKWMSGPIERTGDFLKQFDECGNTRLLDSTRVLRSLSYILWGLFMKLVIADRVATVVDTVYADIPAYGSLTLILIAALYSVQIYCDFAGYTNTMIGISGLFGIELTQNFRLPYLAENMVEFWRRWHISLSNFLKDYVYIPLGGNRKGTFRKNINTMIVFLVCGAWHGAGLNFIVWGLFHGIFNVLAALTKKTRAAFLAEGVAGHIITCILAAFAWIFFRAASLTEAITFIKGMIPSLNSTGLTAGLVLNEELLLGMAVIDWGIALISIAMLIVFDVYAEKNKKILPDIICAKWGITSRAVFLTIITLMILIFGVYGSGDEIRSFVYMQF